MSFARRFIVDTVRAIRRAGSVGLFVVGLLAASGGLVALSERGFISPAVPASLQADASTPTEQVLATPPSEAWSRVIGSRRFETVTDVAMTPENRIVFAGISLAMDEGAPGEAMLIHTDAHGFVYDQIRVRDPRIGSVAKVVLDQDGGARLFHWQGLSPSFAKVNARGDVVWSRSFSGAGEHIWAELVEAEGGETLVAIANNEAIQHNLRILRMDRRGKVLWRRDVNVDGQVYALDMAESGQGGATLAIEGLNLNGDATVQLARFDRRGRPLWARTVYADAPRLAGADLNADGATVLVGGASSALYHFDGNGRVNWVRDVPELSSDGRHLVVESGQGDVHVIAEPLSNSMDRRHWLAQYDPDGRQLWSRTRANRLNATLETANVMRNGLVLAGGSLIAAETGDTDMLMLAVAEGGEFPRGFGAVDTLSPPTLAMMAAAATPADVETEPLERPEGLVGRALAMQAAVELDREAPTVLAESMVSQATDLEPRSVDEIVVADLVAEEEAAQVSPATTQTAAIETPQSEAVRQIAAPATLAATAFNSPAGDPRLNEVDGLYSVASEIALAASNRQPSAPSRKPFHTYACTFTCLAQSDDVVKYPVRRVFRHVSETDLASVSESMMTMDLGVCLATGGRVFDLPREAPVCEPVN